MGTPTTNKTREKKAIWGAEMRRTENHLRLKSVRYRNRDTPGVSQPFAEQEFPFFLGLERGEIEHAPLKKRHVFASKTRKSL